MQRRLTRRHIIQIPMQSTLPIILHPLPMLHLQPIIPLRTENLLNIFDQDFQIVGDGGVGICVCEGGSGAVLEMGEAFGGCEVVLPGLVPDVPGLFEDGVGCHVGGWLVLDGSGNVLWSRGGRW